MADTPGAVLAEAAVAAVEAGETAQSNADAAIERAEDQIEAAQETAEQIARAAMMTEIGRQVEDLRKENETWRGQIQSLIETVGQTQTAQAQELVAMAEAISKLGSPSTLILPLSQAPLTEAAPAVAEVIPPVVKEAEPAAVAAVIAAAPMVAPPPRRRIL